MFNYISPYFKTQRNLNCISTTCDYAQAFSQLASQSTRGKKVISQSFWNSRLVPRASSKSPAQHPAQWQPYLMQEVTGVLSDSGSYKLTPLKFKHKFVLCGSFLTKNVGSCVFPFGFLQILQVSLCCSQNNDFSKDFLM